MAGILLISRAPVLVFSGSNKEGLDRTRSATGTCHVIGSSRPVPVTAFFAPVTWGKERMMGAKRRGCPEAFPGKGTHGCGRWGIESDPARRPPPGPWDSRKVIQTSRPIKPCRIRNAVAETNVAVWRGYRPMAARRDECHLSTDVRNRRARCRRVDDGLKGVG